MKCPVCDEGYLTPVTTTMTFNINGTDVTVDDLQHCICNHCDSDPVLPEQVIYNHNIVSANLHRVNCLSQMPQK